MLLLVSLGKSSQERVDSISSDALRRRGSMEALSWDNLGIQRISSENMERDGSRDADFSAASASTKNVDILLVAIPPTSVEAPDPADRLRFRFRFPGPKYETRFYF